MNDLDIFKHEIELTPDYCQKIREAEHIYVDKIIQTLKNTKKIAILFIIGFSLLMILNLIGIGFIINNSLNKIPLFTPIIDFVIFIILGIFIGLIISYIYKLVYIIRASKFMKEDMLKFKSKINSISDEQLTLLYKSYLKEVKEVKGVINQ